MKKHCSRDLVWRTCFDSQNTNLELCTGSCVNPSCFPCYFINAQDTFDRSLFEGWSVWISLILRSGLDDSKCKFQFVSERACSRDGDVSLGIGSCHPTENSVIASVVHHHPPGNFEFCTFGNMSITTWVSPLATSFIEVLYKVVCSLFLTNFYQ